MVDTDMLIAGVSKAECRRSARTLDSFGSATWYQLHALALNLPRYDRRAADRFVKFLMELPKHMACAVCRFHFKQLLRRLPPDRFAKYGRAGMVALLYNYHSVVNQMLKKSSPVFLTFERMLLRQHAASSVRVRVASQLRGDAVKFNVLTHMKAALRK
jgi:hypothetical protein